MQPTGDNRPLLKQSTGVIQDPVMLDTTTPTVLTGTTAARHDVLHAHSLPLVISVSSSAGIFLVSFITLICIYCLCSQKNVTTKCKHIALYLHDVDTFTRCMYSCFRKLRESIVNFSETASSEDF